MWQMTSNQQYQQLPNIHSSSSSSSTTTATSKIINHNSNNNNKKSSSWPLGILLTLPFIFFIILYNNPDGIVDYSNDTNDIAAVNGIGGNGGGGGDNSLHSGDLNSSSNDGDDDDNDVGESLNNQSKLSSSWIEIVRQLPRPPPPPPSSSDSKTNCICDMNNNSNSQHRPISFIPGQPVHDPERIIIFLITPTYTRPTQAADMTRLSQTLQLVPDIFWIVVEDAHNSSRSVEDLLRRSNVPYVHLLGPRPPTHLDKRSGRGVSNRLRAFEWLRENYSNTTQKGVIYFADDDNAYDVRLFDEIRSTNIVSMFPVGLISTLGLSTPIVSRKSGKIIGFHDPFIGRRKFAVDMAGFAVNLQFFLNQKKATMPYKVGYEEDYFLKSLGVQIWQLEPKAENCTQILVWHTKTKPADQPKLPLMKKVTNYTETNLPDLYANQLGQS